MKIVGLTKLKRERKKFKFFLNKCKKILILSHCVAFDSMDVRTADPKKSFCQSIEL
jgi:hypothetical protein